MAFAGRRRSRALDSATIAVPHCGWRDDRGIAGMKRGDINNQLSVGGQPTEDHLSNLKAEGFAAVINLRRDGEANQPLDPAREGMAATAAGLQYFHIPVNSADPKGEQVTALRAALEQIEGPVYVHCQGGGRACTMALLATAPASGYGAKDVIAEAHRAGFTITNPVMADFVASIFDSES